MPPTRRAAAPSPSDVLEAGGPAEPPRDQAARLPYLLDAVTDLGTGPDLDSALARVVRAAARTTDCRCAAISLHAGERAGPARFVTYGMTPEERERERAGGDPYGRDGRLDAPVTVDGERVGTFTLAGKHGGGHVGEHGGGRAAGGAFTGNDVLLLRLLATEVGSALRNARLHEAARQRERWIEGSAAVTTSLLSGDADNALAVVAEQARRLADAAAGVVLLPTPERGLEIVAASADDARGLIGTVMPPDAAVLRELFAGEPVFVEDSASDPRMVTPVARRFGPSMLLPLRSGGRMIGTLAVPRAPGAAPFTEPEKTLATQFAAQAALALVLADAARDREQLAVYEDRDRIARDLHDLVIQRLFAAGMTLQGAQREAEQAPAGGGEDRTDVPARIGVALDQLDATIAEIRTAIYALQQDPGEAHAGLRTRVLREVGLAAGPLGFRPSVRFAGPVDTRVGEATTRELVAALREALSNASRHAHATRVDVTVDATVTLLDGTPGVRLTVADDGVGIPPDGRRSGLANLARRAENLGGSATWAVGPPEGAGDGGGDGVGTGAGVGAGAGAAADDAASGRTSGTTLTWQGRL
ncbi:GAF domain-containing protein [Streptomyces armeniacus]|uniref:GAF domain-containing protein n=1 Tax=Streptomyces armeniacus TaxID=83291 RepID=A0A345XX06_9ACTN|nr:GAF domain-containing protein [Streptomyces armeniacus]AXK36172.1 GAF domain-containing protein [Streptomyces armeniacus]